MVAHPQAEYLLNKDGTRMKTCVSCTEKNRVRYINKRKETIAISLSSGTPQPQDRICISCKSNGPFRTRINSIVDTGILNKRCNACLDKIERCEHTVLWTCKICNGAGRCVHGNMHHKCKDTTCHRKKNTSLYCWHGRIRSTCVPCDGGEICYHKVRRQRCKVCCPNGHLAFIASSAIRSALNGSKSKRSKEYLGCTIEQFRTYLEKQFKDGQTWENHGKVWHIDHIIPLKYKDGGLNPTLEETVKRLHYTNTQPLWAKENISKGNKYIG